MTIPIWLCLSPEEEKEDENQVCATQRILHNRRKGVTSILYASLFRGFLFTPEWMTHVDTLSLQTDELKGAHGYTPRKGSKVRHVCASFGLCICGMKMAWAALNLCVFSLLGWCFWGCRGAEGPQSSVNKQGTITLLIPLSWIYIYIFFFNWIHCSYFLTWFMLGKITNICLCCMVTCVVLVINITDLPSKTNSWF